MVNTEVNTGVKSEKINREINGETNREMDSRVIKVIQNYGRTKTEGRRLVEKAREVLLGKGKEITEESLLRCAFVCSGD